MEDVARVAGLSRSTVSRVINGSRSFDPQVREAVRRAIADTGYVPSLAARSLVGRRTGTVALVLSGAGGSEDADEGAHQREVFADPFFGRVANGVTRYLAPRGAHPVLISAETDEDHRHVLAYLRRGNADGALLVSTHADDPLPALFPGSGLHAVLFARPARPLPISYVDLAHREGAALAAAHLLARGCEQLATISGPLDVPASLDRLDGFREALARRGHPYVPYVEGNFTLESGEAAAARLLAEFPQVDAIFAANDLMAQGALLVLRDRGRRVPDDVAVVGFDDSRAALASRPLLTTVRQPVEDMAAEMAKLLMALIDDPAQQTRSVIFKTTLVLRESA